MHVSISTGDSNEETRIKIESLVYKPLKEIGGSISAEHGIGLKKKDHLSISRNPGEIALMMRLKEAMDPKGLLNRGKVLPNKN